MSPGPSSCDAHDSITASLPVFAQDGACFQTQDIAMLHYAVVFFVIAIIAAVLGFSGIAGAASNIAWILFVVFLILAVISLFRKKV